MSRIKIRRLHDFFDTTRLRRHRRRTNGLCSKDRHHGGLMREATPEYQLIIPLGFCVARDSAQFPNVLKIFPSYVHDSETFEVTDLFYEMPL